jgi:hypothetical protein
MPRLPPRLPRRDTAHHVGRSARVRAAGPAGLHESSPLIEPDLRALFRRPVTAHVTRQRGSTAVAIWNNWRSWLRATSISPTGSPPTRGNGTNMAQRSKKLTIAGKDGGLHRGDRRVSLRGGPIASLHGRDSLTDGVLQAFHTCAQNEFRLAVALPFVIELHYAEGYFVSALSN